MVNDVDKLKTFIMAIIGIAVLLAVGLVILTEISTSIKDDISATSFSNQSLVWINTSAVTYLDTTCIAGTGSCGSFYNDSANTVLIATSNYTCDSNALTMTTDDTYVTTTTATGYLTYTCKIASTSYTANNSIISKLGTIPTWIGILITIVLAFLVLGYFYNKNN